MAILTKNQNAILQKIAESDFLTKNFYLTGGTALAEFYLRHRLSEDLDFFSEKEFDLLNLDIFFNQTRKGLKITKIDFQQSYNRNLFFLHFNKEVLKIEFTFFPFPKLEKGFKKNNIEIDSLVDIAANKLFTIYQRSKSRDYIDLYFICKKYRFPISDLIKKAKIKFDYDIDLIQLGTQFVKADEVKDYPVMIKKILPREWKNFFIEEAKKLRGGILQ